MAGDISAHSLNNDNLKVDDSDYEDFHSQYKTIGENAADYWNGFLNICIRLAGSEDFKGKLAEKVKTTAEEYRDKDKDGDGFVEAADAAASDMPLYIDEIDRADAQIY